MIDITTAKLNILALHKVGNKLLGDNVLSSKTTTKVSNEEENILLHYFLSSFKSSEYFNFHHEIDINMNEVFVCTSKIFDNSKTLLEQSINIAKHLYEKSTHPKIKGGEFYTAYFKDCIIDNQTVDAVGFFKSENKDTFLKINQVIDGFGIESEKGININKLDKGCIVFNTEKDNGYIVAIVDNTNRGIEAQYWIDDFLHIRQRKDEYYNTKNIMSLCKNFVKDELSQKFEVSKADQIEFLNKSVKFFKENDNFNLSDFTNEVISETAIIDSFRNFKSNYQKEYEIDIADNFSIDNSAVKKQSRILKNVIKLDKNFDIHIHGNRNLIEQGKDAKGKFYKIYYNEEN